MRFPRSIVTTFLGALVVAAPGAVNTSWAANLPMPAPQLQQRLMNDEFVILAAKGAGGGVMGAQKLTLQFATEPTTIDVKWKATGHGGEGWNNSPHREIGTYEVQRLFLDVDQYLVPPTVARCIAIDAYTPVQRDATPTFPATRCEFGVLAAWLSNVKLPDHAFDRARFSQDRAYAVDFANLNLLHYLVDHRDARANNLLISTDPADPRVFSIDNGIAFGGVLYNFFTWHFNDIIVPLPRPAIERLRRVSRADLDRLGVLAQLEVDAAGVLRNVTPGPNIDPDNVMRRAPWGVQFGLTRAEIDGLAERLRRLLVRIDEGKQPTF